MNLTRRSVRSKPGLTQEAALISLQEDPSFRPGVDKITSLRRRGSRWVAELSFPKQAGPPPAFAESGDDESAAPEVGSDDDAPDGPPSSPPGSEDSGDAGPEDSGSEGPPKPDDGKEKGKGGVESEILQTLQAILHALGGGGPEGMGGPDALGPGPEGPPGPPPAHKGPGRPPGAGAGPPEMGGAPKPGRPMKPGEAPPGSTPIGAPAFASTRQANPGMGAPAPVPSAGGAAPGGAPGGLCPECGMPEPCPMHSGQATNQPIGGGAAGMSPVAALQKELAPFIGRNSTLTISTGEGQAINDVIRTVRAAVEPHGYQVKQAKRVNGGIRVLASVR